jgi:hypothetical protein
MEFLIAAWPTIKDCGLLLIAIYGAGLSTFNWYKAVKKDRRMMRVTVSEHHKSGEMFPFAKIEATNTGYRTVTVKTLTFETPYGLRIDRVESEKFSTPSYTALPISLSDGQSAYLYVSFLYIANKLKEQKQNGETRLTPVCEDSAGGIYKGESWDVDPDKMVPLA